MWEVSMPFGPGDLLYETYGDRRGFLVAPAVGLMQLMYPDLGRGVEQHSAFYDEPLERLFRSVPQIQGTIFDGPRAGETAGRVREFHREIKGTMADGRRYHALDPDTYWWAHATFIDTVFRVTDLFWARPLTPVQKQAVYAEGVEWWKMYGLSMRPVPPTYADFQRYWQHMLDDVLEATPAAQALADFFQRPHRMPQPWLPDPLWKAVGPIGGLGFRELLVGAVPPEVRERYGMRWTRRNQAAFDAFRRAVAWSWPAVPYRFRIMPRARAAHRTQGRLGVRAALAAAQARGPVEPDVSSPRVDAG
jgi:uncharacterized protein (DUF2236 family)